MCVSEEGCCGPLSESCRAVRGGGSPPDLGNWAVEEGDGRGVGVFDGLRALAPNKNGRERGGVKKGCLCREGVYEMPLNSRLLVSGPYGGR